MRLLNIPIIISVAPAVIPFLSSVAYGSLGSLVIGIIAQALVSFTLFCFWKRYLIRQEGK